MKWLKYTFSEDIPVITEISMEAFTKGVILWNYSIGYSFGKEELFIWLEPYLLTI